jgi:hypothetical protein
VLISTPSSFRLTCAMYSSRRSKDVEVRMKSRIAQQFFSWIIAQHISLPILTL